VALHLILLHPHQFHLLAMVVRLPFHLHLLLLEVLVLLLLLPLLVLRQPL
jgi:hypothetical protein